MLNYEDDIQLITEWPVSANCVPIETQLAPVDDHRAEIELSIQKKTSRIKPFLLKRNHDIVSGNTALCQSTKSARTFNYSAKAVLSKWWKKYSQSKFRKENQETNRTIYHENVNLTADSRLILISKLPAAQAFMQQQIQQLTYQCSHDLVPDEAATVHCKLSWFHERLQNYTEAHQHIVKAVTLKPQDKNVRWRRIKIERQLDMCSIQSSQLRNVARVRVSPAPTTLTVDRVHVDDLSCADFFTLYASTHTPLIITGLSSTITRVPWTLDHIRRLAGSCVVTTKVSASESVEWAKLEPFTTTTVAEYLERLTTDPHCRDYLFDWSLPLHCPTLLHDVTIPRYFANDFLQRTHPGSLYADSWPSLFIGPPNITSELHVDSFASNFWMALFQGTKRWTFFQQRDTALLYPRLYESMDPVFEVDVCSPDLDRHPLLQLATPYQCVLQPGEVLFVPSGCPHRVENLETSVAISANFVDASNFERVKKELEVNGLLDPCADGLHKQLCDLRFDSVMNMDSGHLPWTLFKRYTSEQH